MKNNNSKYYLLMVSTVILIVVAFIYTFVDPDYNSNNVAPTSNSNVVDLAATDSEENIETSYELNDELSIKLSSKINFTSYTLENLVNLESISTLDISNELALEMCWSRLDAANALNYEAITDIAAIKYSATYSEIESVFNDIFGFNYSCPKTSFNALDEELFSGYANYDGDVNIEDDVFYVMSYQGGGANMPYIYQSFDNLKVDGTKATLSVKIGFANPLEEDEYGEINDIYPAIYKSFNNGNFEDFVFRANTVDFNQEIDSSQNSLTPNTDLDYAHDLLNTYAYTFEYNEETKDYYLIDFSLIK